MKVRPPAPRKRMLSTVHYGYSQRETEKSGGSGAETARPYLRMIMAKLPAMGAS
ncbi:hypothetical protein HYS49_00365 [Candidatus Woesearchaeota archaeon]|nr:hypothetical protein [Candidatus Woesearchaeota archaeon]